MSGDVQLGAYIRGDEVIVEAVETEGSGIVVTDRRVLAFTPARSDLDVPEVDLSNVIDVTTGATDSRPGPIALACAIVGVPFALAGLLLNVDVLGGQLDTILLGLGGAVVVGGLVLGVLSWYRREQTVVISVAGAQNIEVRWPSEGEGAPMPADAAASVANAVISAREGDDTPADG